MKAQTKNTIQGKGKKIEIIVEKNDGILWGIIEGKGAFTPTPYGKTIKDVIANLKEIVTDYVKNEGSNDKYWSKIDLSKVEFDIKYHVEAFFQEHNYLNVSGVAKIAGVNPGLLRQYTSGVKSPSIDQIKKIETALRKIGLELSHTKVLA